MVKLVRTFAASVLEAESLPLVARSTDFRGEECRLDNLLGMRPFCIRVFFEIGPMIQGIPP